VPQTFYPAEWQHCNILSSYHGFFNPCLVPNRSSLNLDGCCRLSPELRARTERLRDGWKPAAQHPELGDVSSHEEELGMEISYQLEESMLWLRGLDT
jgi:hypothetical protein